MRPIPRALLIHSATLATAETDGYQNETLTPVAELTRVRVEPIETETLSTRETRAQTTALLVYDARNSLPKGVTFAAGQRVLYGGECYRVETVAQLYDGRRLHHTEIGLGR